MKHLTAPRGATVTTLLALIAEAAAPSPLVSFYCVAVGAASLIGCGFLAYLASVDSPAPRSVFTLAAIGLAGALAMADAAVRFPMMLNAHAPHGPGPLAQGALALSALSLFSELPSLARLPRPHVRA